MKANTLAALAATAALAASLAGASVAQAGTVTMDFASVPVGDYINGFFDGGTSSSGASGPNYGVGFVNFFVVCGYGAYPSGCYADDGPSPSTVNVAKGFVNSISFHYGSYTDVPLNIYSGIGGTGALLGSFDLPAANPFDQFIPVTLTFSGTARSFVVSSPSDYTGIDDLILTTVTGVPEPTAWATMLFGFFGIGLAARRRPRIAQ